VFTKEKFINIIPDKILSEISTYAGNFQKNYFVTTLKIKLGDNIVQFSLLEEKIHILVELNH